MIVTLTDDEYDYAIDIGKRRHAEHVMANNFDTKANPLADGESLHIIGALGEKAASKGLQLPWDNNFLKFDEWKQKRFIIKDVGNIGVRTITQRHHKLILHKKDNDSTAFVLVLKISENTYELIGWCFARDGKKQEWWHDVGYGKPCYFVPHSGLKNIESIFMRKPTKKSSICKTQKSLFNF